MVKGTSRSLWRGRFRPIATPFIVCKSRGIRITPTAHGMRLRSTPCSTTSHQIDSFCHYCAGIIQIEFKGGQAAVVEPATTIVYLALRPTEWWEDIITTCSNTMVFFCSGDHRDASGLSAPADQAASLIPSRRTILACLSTNDRLKLEYVRPGRDELNAHFASLG